MLRAEWSCPKATTELGTDTRGRVPEAYHSPVWLSLSWCVGGGVGAGVQMGSSAALTPPALDPSCSEGVGEGEAWGWVYRES